MSLLPELLQGFQLNFLQVLPLRGLVTDQAGRRIHLEPKVMEVLVCLSGHANKVTTREQLIACVWPNMSGADNQLSRAISELRHALHMVDGEQPYIETSPKRGYRLIGQVEPLVLPNTTSPASQGDVPGQSKSGRSPIVLGSLLCVFILAISYLQWESRRVEQDAIAAAQVEDANGNTTTIQIVSTGNEQAIKHYWEGMQRQAYMGNEDLRSAEVSFRKALTFDSQFLEAQIELAYTYWAMYYIGELERAEAKNRIQPMLEQLIEQAPHDSVVVALDTFQRWEDGVDSDQRIASFTDAIAHQPWESRGYLHLALLLWHNNRTDEALSWLNRGLVIAPDDIGLRRARARLLHSDGSLDEASEAFAEVLKLNPTDATMLVGLADIDFARGNYSEWFDKMLRAMKLQPLDYEIPAHIAYCLYSLGLVNDGDWYLGHAESIAAGRSRTRVVELYRSVVLADFAKAHDLSEAILFERIDNRRGAFSLTLLVYVTVMDALDRSAGIMNKLEQLVPGVTAADYQPKSELEHIVQSYVNLMRMYPAAAELDGNVLGDAVFSQVNKNLGWPTPVEIEPSLALALGEQDRAVELILTRLDTSMAFFWASLITPEKGGSRFLSPLAQEPAVAHRLAGLASDKQKAATEVSRYIAEHDLHL